MATVTTCRLEAGGDFDQTQTSVAGGGSASLSLNVAHNFSAAGTADFKCEGSLPGAQANFIKISAIRLASLTSTG